MFSRIGLILLLFIVSVQSQNLSTQASTTSSGALPPNTPRGADPDASDLGTTAAVPGECEGKDQFATFAMVMLAAVSVLQFLFAITVTVAAIFVLSKLSEKMREAETHLHQVMDATLCALFPEAVVAEINAVAEEAQVQNRKPKTKTLDGSKKDEKDKENNEKNKSAKSAKSATKSPAAGAK